MNLVDNDAQLWYTYYVRETGKTKRSGTTTRQSCLKIMTDRHIELLSEDSGVLEVWSPSGLIFNSTMCHCMIINYEERVPHPHGEPVWVIKSDKQGAWRDLLEVLQDGLVECNVEECDVCEPS